MNIEPIQAIPTLDYSLPESIEKRIEPATLKPAEHNKEQESEPQATDHQPVNRIQESESLSEHRVNFRIDEGSGRTIIRVVDSKTHEVLQEFPQTQILEITERMKSIMGLFYDHEA
ncbi:flagellar protein FlaG [bacterium]|nr:flagellar protein FlaG [bacterium]